LRSTHYYTRNNELLDNIEDHTLGSGTEGGEYYDILLSTGYVLTPQMGNINFILGLNPTYYNFNSLDLISESNKYLLKREVQATHYQMRIPLFINYYPTSWLSLVGGFQYTYSWSHEEILYNNIQIIEGNSGIPIPDYHISNRKDDTTNSDSRFYLGMSLRHPAGIVCHISFNGYPMEYNNWNISLGYHFN